MQLEYCPSGLSFGSFSRVDSECFPDEPLRERDFLRYIDEGFWGAFDGGTLVGFCYVILRPDLAWLSRIGVSSSHRGRGIGRKLMGRALRYCRGKGIRDVMLYVESGNSIAIALYESLGFAGIEEACQYVLHDPMEVPVSLRGTAEAVPIGSVPEEDRPEFPGEWSDIENMHCPPEQHVLMFRDGSGAFIGYCRLNPGFPGCFPFSVDDPERNLGPVLCALKPYLDPAQPILKLTFSSEGMDRTCSSMGMELNYRLIRMLRTDLSGAGKGHG